MSHHAMCCGASFRLPAPHGGQNREMRPMLRNIGTSQVSDRLKCSGVFRQNGHPQVSACSGSGTQSGVTAT